MSRLLSLAAAGLVACLMLATPSQAQAQHGRFGTTNCGPGYVGGYNSNYGQGFQGGYGYQGGYGNYYGGGHGWNNSFYQRPTIVHPESLHWTPNRGIHTHGHIHVPHRGHYHTRPY